MIEDSTHFHFYCVECFADSSQDCICKKILGYDKDTDIPVVDLTDEECEYLSKCGIDKKEDSV